jgi:hypothetical protein
MLHNMAIARKIYTSLHVFSSKTHRLSARVPAYALTLAGTTPKTLKVEIPQAWPTEYAISEAFQNTFALLCSGRSLCFECPETFWAMSGLTEEEKAELHEFSWLSILVTIGTTPQRLLARNLVFSWIERFSKISPLVWHPNILSKRLSAWVHAYGFVARTADASFRHVFLKSLVKQYRYLRRTTTLDNVQLMDLHLAKGVLCTTVALYGRAGHFLTKTVTDFCLALEKNVSLEDGYPWELLEALRLLIDIRTALGRVHALPPKGLLDEMARCFAERLRLLQQPDSSLSLLGSKYIPKKDIVALALVRAHIPSPHTAVARVAPRFLSIKTANHMILVQKEAFSPSTKKAFSPLNTEYSYQEKRLILGGQIHVMNDAFHGASYTSTTSARVLPLLEMQQDKGKYWIRGLARWHLEGEPFCLKRNLLFVSEDGSLRGEETLSSPPGFSTSLLFTFFDKGEFCLQDACLSCRLSETKEWHFCFSSGICAELRSGPSVLREGLPVATKVLVLYYPTDEETSTLRWGMRVSFQS